MSQRDALPDDPRIAGSDAMTATARLHEVVIALEEMDKRAELLRAERNQLLYLAMTNEGCSERAAAELGKIGPSYAHRIRVYQGNPPSGPLMNRAPAVARTDDLASHPRSVAGGVLHNGWTEKSLREGLRLAPPRAQDILRYIAAHPRCTSAEIADDLALTGARSVGPTLNQLTKAVEHLEVRDADGKFRWPLEFPGKRGTYWLYDMPPAVRSVVFDVLGHT